MDIGLDNHALSLMPFQAIKLRRGRHRDNPHSGVHCDPSNFSQCVCRRLTKLSGKELKAVGDHGLAAFASVIGLHNCSTHDGYLGCIAKMLIKLEVWNDDNHILVFA